MVPAYLGRSWNGKERFTRINLGNDIQVESFDPVTKEGIRMTIPREMLISTVGNRGSWPAGVMTKMENKYGSKWAADSVADTLGISYTITGRLPNLWDKWSWWNWQNKIEWQEIDLGKTAAVTDGTDPDGVKVLLLSDWGEKKMAEWMISTAIAAEEIPVTVVNTTKTDGLGNHAARVINNTGMRVSAVLNTQENLPKCQLERPDNLKNSLTVDWLVKTFSCELSGAGKTATEVKLKLGNDYVKWWKGD